MKDSSESLIGEQVVLEKSWESRFSWNTARENVGGHQVRWKTAREGVGCHHHFGHRSVGVQQEAFA